MTAATLNDDFLDALRALLSAGAEFLVVGAHAMAVHGVPRATGDLDIWVRPTTTNAAKVFDALRTFGAPLENHGVLPRDFETPDTVYQIGIPPRRIDVLTSVSGVTFESAWPDRVEVEIAGARVPFIGRSALISNKRASGREKDVIDLRLLETGKG